MGSSEAGRIYAPGRRRAWRAIEAGRRAAQELARVASTCEVCGAEAQGHHFDYAQPLKVEHLCQRHHSFAHHRAMAHKIDNGELGAKLDLRRHFLAAYHQASPPAVFDACCGDGVLWGRLRQEFSLGRYFGVDKKKARGRLQIDSLRLLSVEGLDHDVFDLDTYGSPWRHWVRVLENSIRPRVTVFLTIGSTGMHGCMDFEAWQLAGLTDPQHLPNGFGRKFSAELTHDLLGLALARWSVVEAAEAEASGSARYVGVRLESRR